MVDGLNKNTGCYVQRGKVQTLLLGNHRRERKDECPMHRRVKRWHDDSMHSHGIVEPQ